MIDCKLDLVIIPVSVVDRAKAYTPLHRSSWLGFTPDIDQVVSGEIRFIQLTPPGSACSIAIGKGLSDADPGSVRGRQVVVADIHAAHDELATNAVDVTEVDVHRGDRQLQRSRRQRLVGAAGPRPRLITPSCCVGDGPGDEHMAGSPGRRANPQSDLETLIRLVMEPGRRQLRARAASASRRSL